MPDTFWYRSGFVPLKVITLTEQWLEILMCPDKHGLTVAETCRRYQISRSCRACDDSGSRQSSVETRP